MNKTILSDLGGFTPIIDAVTEDVGLMTSVVYGLVWRHCQMRDGVCRKSVNELAKMIGVSTRTIRRHLETLCEAGYIEDRTPDLVNRPHIYADAGRVKITSKISVEVSDRSDRESQQVNPAKICCDSESQQGDRESQHAVTQSPLSKTHEETNEETKESGAKNAPPTPASSSENQPKISNKHPAIQAYKRGMHRYPQKNHWGDIAAAVGDNPADVKRWEETVKAWKLTGWNPQNTGGMLDYYRRGEIPSTRPQPAPQNGSNSGLSSYERRRKLL